MGLYSPEQRKEGKKEAQLTLAVSIIITTFANIQESFKVMIIIKIQTSKLNSICTNKSFLIIIKINLLLRLLQPINSIYLRETGILIRLLILLLLYRLLYNEWSLIGDAGRIRTYGWFHPSLVFKTRAISQTRPLRQKARHKLWPQKGFEPLIFAVLERCPNHLDDFGELFRCACLDELQMTSQERSVVRKCYESRSFSTALRTLLNFRKAFIPLSVYPLRKTVGINCLPIVPAK